METTARPQPSGGILTTIVVLVLIGLALAVGWNVIRDEQDRATYYAQQTAQAIAPAPTTQPARPTSLPPAPQAPMIVQTVPNDAAPQIVAPQPAPQAAPVGEAAPAPRPLIIVHHQSNDGHQTITGSGACAVGGSVARRCGK